MLYILINIINNTYYYYYYDFNLFLYIKSQRRLSTLKIICNQKILANRIGIAQKAINGKTTIELLKGILISTEEGQLKLTGYDAEIG
ncbi:hypothetical protein, partial [Mammaliicoccus sciuri]